MVPPFSVAGADHVNGTLEARAVPATNDRGAVVTPDSVAFDAVVVKALSACAVCAATWNW
jgi:hypothetical protein